MSKKAQKLKITLEKLAVMTQRGFLSVEKKIDVVNVHLSAKINEVDMRLTKEIGEVKSDVQWIKSEGFGKLDKFIQLYEDQRQELIMLSEQLRRLEKRIAVLELGKGQ